MKLPRRHILMAVTLLCMVAGMAYASAADHIFITARVREVVRTEADSTRFPVRSTTAQSEEDNRHAADLRDPENLKTGIFYDEKTGSYRFGTKLGDNFLESPFYMTEAEYQRWAMERGIRQYFKKKNADAYKEAGKRN